MSKTKSVTTVQTIKLDGGAVGLIMQDEAGYFYRPKGKSGLHNPKWDGEHFPTVAAVMQSVNGDSEALQATAEPVKGAKPNKGKPQPAKTPQSAPKAVTEASRPVEPVAPAKVPTPEKAAAVVPVVAPGAVSSVIPAGVRYKLVETTGTVGTHYWLYAGYMHAKGFKWNGSGGFMFFDMEAVTEFLNLNGIPEPSTMETVDVTNGSYDPNKGVIPLYVPGQQTKMF